MPLWEQVKGNLIEWYSIASDKTEELAKIGVRRYDKLGISRDIERQFAELGSFVYNAIDEGREDFATDATLLGIVERIKVLEYDLQQKETEIEDIRATSRQKSTSRTSDESPETTTAVVQTADEAVSSAPVEPSAGEETAEFTETNDDAEFGAENESKPGSDDQTTPFADDSRRPDE